MQIEKILMQYPEVGTNYLITIKTENNNDDLIIEVEKGNAPIADERALCKSITRKLKDELLLTPCVILREKGEIPNAEGKAVRVKDLRPKE
jgi:phenylacetate-CoA ligase